MLKKVITTTTTILVITSIAINDFEPQQWYWSQGYTRLYNFSPDPCINFVAFFTGRGVFAKKTFNQGDFILEYRGDLISDSEAQRRREVYTPTQRVFIFDLAGKSLW